MFCVGHHCSEGCEKIGMIVETSNKDDERRWRIGPRTKDEKGL